MLQAIRLKYLHPDSELPNFSVQVMDMLRVDPSADSHALVFQQFKPLRFYFSSLFFIIKSCFFSK